MDDEDEYGAEVDALKSKYLEISNGEDIAVVAPAMVISLVNIHNQMDAEQSQALVQTLEETIVVLKKLQQFKKEPTH